MTTVTEKRVRCCLCSAENEFIGIGSTNAFGSSDLDTRPPEMARSTIWAWVQCCQECGYCASDVAAPRPEAADVVSTKEYKRQLLDPTYPVWANSFLCKALIDSACREFSAATWALIHAAWVCDDSNRPDQAVMCREKAAEMLAVAEEHGQQVAKPGGWSTCILVDLLRRSGRLDDAQSVIAARRDTITEDDIVRILDFQTALIEKNDILCHTAAEVFGKEQQTGRGSHGRF
jgi:hypothetical protein